MNPDVFLRKKGYFFITISNLYQYDDDSKVILFDATINPISEEEIYKEIYGQERVNVQSLLVRGNMPYIENIDFIPYFWDKVFK